MPKVVILAGPNGAGKSTVADQLVGRVLGIDYFVNADTLAVGLARFNPWQVRADARRIQDEWLRELTRRGESFAFETTLASRRWADWIERFQQAGFSVELLFIWVSSPDLAIGRVRQRVAAGGHHVPDEIVRGRYVAGVRNLLDLYCDMVDSWQVYDNSGWTVRLVATGMGLGSGLGQTRTIADRVAWDLMGGAL